MSSEEKNTTGDDAQALDGAALLTKVDAVLRQFVILPSEHAYTAIVLWIVATHAVPAFEHATRLAVHSAVKRCGKSRLLEIIEALSHKPISTTNISTAALFRVIDAAGAHPPTLILDEADRLFGDAKKDDDNRELIALINNGFRLGSPTWRCVGPLQTPTPFSNFAMAVVAGIGRKPDTIEDRAVNLTMRRRLPGETVAKFKIRRDVPVLHELRDQVAAWAAQNITAMAEPVDNIPDELEDRAEDAWEPLLAVADIAGGDWPKLAREAAVALAEEAAEVDGQQSEEIRLIGDIHEVFASLPHVSFLATNNVLNELRKVDDAPWGEMEFTARKLALRLGKFNIRPRHNSAKSERGYHLSDFKDAFGRYLPSEPSEPSERDKTTGEGPDASPDGNGRGTVRNSAADASKRPDTSIRPDEIAGQPVHGRVRTVRTDTSDTCERCWWPLASTGHEERCGDVA
jgi:hypothetical protein